MKISSVLLSSCLIIILVISQLGCKKNRTEELPQITTFDAEHFFKGTENADNPTKRLVNFLKQQQERSPNFLPSVVKNCGYPIWNKATHKYPKGTTGRTTSEGSQDTIIQVPFVNNTIENVNAFVEAVVNDSISVALFEKNKYTLLPKGAVDATTLTAERYLNEFFLLQNATFNHQYFKILDSTLFKNLLPNNTGVVKHIQIGQTDSSDSEVNIVPVDNDGCIRYTITWTTFTDNGIVLHRQHKKVCPIAQVPVQSVLMADMEGGGGGNSALGNINGFNWSAFFNSGGGGGGGIPGSGGTQVGGNPYTGAGNNANGIVQPVMGFISVDDDYALLNEIKEDITNLTPEEEDFLLGHIDQMMEIINYLNANNSQENKDKVKKHIEDMRTNTEYKNFVINHSNTSPNVKVWWDDTTWLDNPNNFNINVDNINNDYGFKLTQAEIALINKYPKSAFRVFMNMKIVNDRTTAIMGVNTVNDKSDAYRHAYFSCLNSMSCELDLGPPVLTPNDIAVLFANARESEVPSHLQLEKQMDLFNNNVGFNYAVFYFPPSATIDNIETALYLAIFMGEMKYLTPTDPLTPQNRYHPVTNPTGTDGIKSDTELKKTNQ